MGLGRMMTCGPVRRAVSRKIQRGKMKSNDMVRLRNGVKISREALDQIIEMRKQGKTPEQVEKATGYTARTVNIATKHIPFDVNWIGDTPINHKKMCDIASRHTTYSAVAREMGLSERQVKEYFSRYKLRLRPRSTSIFDGIDPLHRQKSKKVTPEIERAIRTALLEGYSKAETAKILGITSHSVDKIAARHGLNGLNGKSGQRCRVYDPVFDGPPSEMIKRWTGGKARAGRRMPEHIVIKGPDKFQEIANPLRRLGYVCYPLDNDKENGWFKLGQRDVRWKELCRLSRKARKKLEKRENGRT